MPHLKTMLTVTGCADCLNKENVEVVLCYWDLDGKYHSGPVVFLVDRCPRCGSTQVCHYARKDLKGTWEEKDGYSTWSRGKGAARRPIPGARG